MTAPNSELSSPARDILLGLSIGDALGVPVEFNPREILRNDPVINMRAFGTHNQEAGTWSDDSSLSFCLADSIANGFVLQDVATNFAQWLGDNYWTANNEVFDVGNSTMRAIQRLKHGTSPLLSGDTEDYNNGNGALMRIAPLVLYVKNLEMHERFEVCNAVSGITHAHWRSKIACFYYLEFLLGLLNKQNPLHIYQNLQKSIPDFIEKYCSEGRDELKHFERLLHGEIQKLPETEIESRGYVMHTLEASIWCLLNGNSYEATVLMAVNLGNDSDTTGTVTGALAGLFYGHSSIPLFWLEVLKRRKDIEELAEKLGKAFLLGEI
jgi:ADP-ribosyl-[dinitrogen reductase] hydrolase